MLRIALIALTACLAVTPALGALGDVVSSFPAPANYPYAVACSVSYIYVYCGTSPYNVYTCTPTGSVVSSFASPHGYRTRGVGYEYGNYLWLGYYGSSVARVAKVNAANGSIISTFPVASVHTLYGGVACQGNPGSPGITSVISNDYLPYVASRHTTTGSLINTFTYSSGTPSFRDPAWDYSNNLIWWGHYTNSNPYVYGYTTAGSMVASFPAPGSYPYGCGYYGGYLWLSRSASGSYYVYQIECPRNLTIKPASVGKVKALFR